MNVLARHTPAGPHQPGLTFYKGSALPVWVNILGCLAMAFIVIGLTGLISRLGYRMKA